jgi:hypothetical protein
MYASSTQARRLLGLTLTVVFCGCGGGDDVTTIDPEVFIATYVDLRAEALLNDSQQITDEERAQVLGEHDVTEEELLAFADIHGRDVTFMRDLWDQVEERLDLMRPLIDESGRVVRPIRPEN